ncbi:hypothetical protein [Pseudomonas putida]
MFERRPGGRATCSKACAKAVERQKKAPKPTAKEKKIERRKQRLLECAFGYWLIEQARRAKTVQTYLGITADALRQLHDLHNYRKKRYGWVNAGHGQDEYQLCHVQPLVGRDGSVGLSIPSNVFTGIALLNQRQGNKPVNTWAGASIPATDLKRKWLVTKTMTRDEVLQKLADYLGPELDKFLDELEKIPQRTARLRLARTIHRRQSDDSFEPLVYCYTLAELESRPLDELQQLDAIQRGRTGVNGLILGNCPPDSKLGVLCDELDRFVRIQPEGQHKENCRFMLLLVRLVGIYLAQIRDQQGTARGRFLNLTNATWAPLQYLCPSNPWKTSPRILEADRQMLITSITEAAQDALQGLDVPAELLKARVLKRLHLQSLLPEVTAPDQWSWEACGSNWLGYIDHLHSSLQPTWQTLKDIGLCSQIQILDAQDAVIYRLMASVDQARSDFRRLVYNKWAKSYPPHLEYPPSSIMPAAFDSTVIGIG